MTDRPLELDDIQGNVLGGFNTDIQVLVALTVSKANSFRSAAIWLASLAPSLTVVSEVRAKRDFIKFAKADPQATWLCVAIGQRLLKATHPEVLIRDNAFNQGMLTRAPSVLGDKTDSSKWRVGGPDAPVDVLLIIAANGERAVVARADQLVAEATAAGLAATYRETARRIGDREHFGFRDGISQPKVIGDDLDGNLGAGNFIFGYPKEAGQPPYWPVVDEARLTDNGSLLVFRRLVQNVPVFRKFCEEEAARLAPQWPGLKQDHLAAFLVGRWPSGAPVKSGQTQDPLGDPPDNAFDFGDDAEPLSCPYGAHVRKVNPRAGKKDLRPVPRMLRRGIPFGPAYDIAPGESDRGLAFLAFQSSITSQFETLTLRWMNSALNPGSGNDLLVGRAEGVRTMQIPGPNGPIDVSTSERQWIVPTGGAYLFAPSRTGLRKLGEPPSPLGLWKAKQFLAIASDKIQSALFE